MTGPLAGLSVTLLSGTGAHADAWHDLAATGARAAGVLRGAGAEVAERTTGDGNGVRRAEQAPGVLVLNASGDLAVPPGDSTGLVDEIVDHVERRGGLVALHSSSLAFRDDARWAELLGGRWVPGVSTHPPIGQALVRGVHRLAPRDFVVHDERYTGLEQAEAATTVALHREGGGTHPLVWIMERGGARGRVAYDALGHGVESYDSEGHRALLVALVGWAAARAQTP